MMAKQRYEMLDYLKGIAVIMMVFFHIGFDLSLFKFIDANMSKDLFWYIQPKIIITLFLISVGMSLCLVHVKQIQWYKFTKRFAKILALALLITVVTYFVFPKRFVYFGMLHQIAFSSLCGLLFIRRPKLAVILGIALIVPSLFFGFRYPFFRMPHIRAVDYVPPLPWFGLTLIGIYLYSIKAYTLNIPKHFGKNGILFLGRHSLLIYMTHQGVIFPIVYGFHLLLH